MAKTEVYSVLQGKRLIVAHCNVAYLYSVHGITIVRDTLKEYISNHIVADTRVLFHIQNLAKRGNKGIVIRCNDTDVLVILLYLASSFHQQSYGWSWVILIITVDAVLM